jgi:hypothetical protein
MRGPMLCERVPIDGLEATIFAYERHVFVRTFVSRKTFLIDALLAASHADELGIV